jgi:hypothetical protein
VLLTFHVAAGGLAMILGFAALFSRKGSLVHRRSGQLFAVSILGMAISASILGLRDPAREGDLVPALMTAYFVGTAVATVRSSSLWSKRVSFLATAMAVVVALALIASGIQGITSPLLTPGGVPARTIGVMSLVLATILAVAVAGDLRVMRSGPLQGSARLARHLWRMCIALFIASAPFLSIRERVAAILPEPFPSAPLRALPIVIIFGAMAYWLWRVRRRTP